MCGILGIKNTYSTAAEKEAAAERMLTVQAHRGPDARAISHCDATTLFGHNRLSIIDLSEKGTQPMQSSDGKLSIVFNGEIYNYLALRKTLIQQGYLFSSETDTEVVLYAYHAYGKDMLKKIDGMFSLAIYDSTEQSLLLARDRFGKKPLFYYHHQDTFVFASELKTLLASGLVPSVPDADAIDLFLTLQYIPAPYTIYKDVKHLQASECLVFKNDNIETELYYQVRYKPDIAKLSYADAVDVLRDTLSESVKKRMMSDVPLGAFLSGGVDSSIITALLATHSTQPIHTISVGFKEERFSELTKAKSMAERYETLHHEYTLDLQEACEKVTDIIACYDQPFGDSSAIPSYFLAREAKQQVTVALSGDGGDELFAGYPRYFLDKRFNTLQNNIPALFWHPMLALLQKMPSRKNVPIEQNWMLGLKRLKQVYHTPPEASIVRWGSYFSFAHKQQLYAQYPYMQDRASQYLSDIFEQASQFPDFTTRTQYTDLRSYAPGDYLVKVDIASMQHHLEVRAPLLDTALVEFAFSLPQSLHAKGMKGKKLLRDAFSHLLTPEVLHGAKHGFSVPMVEWFKGSWLDILQDYLNSSESFCAQYFNRSYIDKLIVEHLHNRDDHAKRLYLLLVLEVWYSTHLANEKQRAVFTSAR